MLSSGENANRPDYRYNSTSSFSLVEHRSTEPKVAGSSPAGCIHFFILEMKSEKSKKYFDYYTRRSLCHCRKIESSSARKRPRISSAARWAAYDSLQERRSSGRHTYRPRPSSTISTRSEEKRKRKLALAGLASTPSFFVSLFPVALPMLVLPLGVERDGKNETHKTDDRLVRDHSVAAPGTAWAGAWNGLPIVPSSLFAGRINPRGKSIFLPLTSSNPC